MWLKRQRKSELEIERQRDSKRGKLDNQQQSKPYLQQSVPDVETGHVMTIVEDGDLLEAGDQGEPLVLFRLFIPAEQGGVGVEALLVPVHNGVQQSGPGIIVCSCFPSTQNVRKFRLVSCNTTVCPRSSDLFYKERYHIKWVTTYWTYSISK